MRSLCLACVLFAGVLTGCAGPQHSPDKYIPGAPVETRGLVFEADLFGEQPDIIAVEDIYRLSEEQQKSFQSYFNDLGRQRIPPHQRVYEYLESITMNFGYQGETFTAEEALRKSSGNCLSLAILTSALAELAGVDVGYQLVDSLPVFESQGNVVFKGQHVRTMLYSPEKKLEDEGAGYNLTLRRGGLLVDYFPSGGGRFVSNISEAEYQTMYYNNRASEAISKADYASAFWLLRKALELTPDDVGAINSMAIVYRRAGNAEKSEEIYKYGINYLPNKLSLLRNYRVLLMEQERFTEVDEVNVTLAELDGVSPFDWLHAGHDAYTDGDFREAISFYQKAVEIAPYLHESYAGMAKAHYQLGNRVSAKRELLNAQKYSYRKSFQSLYQAKLVALASEH